MAIRANMRTAGIALLAVALAGCTVGPDFRPPAVDAPRDWGPPLADLPGGTSAVEPDPRWWRSFNDEQLNYLMDRLVAQNLALDAAAERITQGRAERGVALSAGLPQIGGKASYERFRYSPAGNPLGLVVPRPGSQAETDIFTEGLNSSWELDLFGRVRRNVEAANADTQAAEEDRNDMILSLEAELAQDYFALRGVQARLAIARANEGLAAQNVDLVDRRQQFGVATTLEFAQARTQQEVVAETLPPLLARQAGLINAIGLLLSQRPRSLETELQPFALQPILPTTIPVGLPATTVRRRPDIRRAEARLHAATARTGVAVADFYPDVSLVGSFELNSLSFKDAFNLYSRMFEVGPSVSLPIFQGGRLRAVLRLRQSQQREAAIDFQDTLLRAWREVDDALTELGQAQARKRHSARAVTEARKGLDAARQRYLAGAASFLNVVSAQVQLLSSQNDKAGDTTQTAIDLVQLYRVLGGGW